jgi:hypothetical protein
MTTTNLKLIRTDEATELYDEIRTNGLEWADDNVDWTDWVTGKDAKFTDADFEDDAAYDARWLAIRQFVIESIGIEYRPHRLYAV